MRKCRELSILDLSTGLKPLRMKLPDFLQNEWRRFGQNYEDAHYGEHLPFTEFTKFLDKQARLLSNRNYINVSSSDKIRQTVKVLQTSGEEIGSSNPKTLPSAQPQNEVTICQFHKSDKHALSDCKSFKRLNFSDKKKNCI